MRRLLGGAAVAVGLGGCVQLYPVPVPVDPVANPAAGRGAAIGAGAGQMWGAMVGDPAWGAALGAQIGAISGQYGDRRDDPGGPAQVPPSAWPGGAAGEPGEDGVIPER